MTDHRAGTVEIARWPRMMDELSGALWRGRGVMNAAASEMAFCAPLMVVMARSSDRTEDCCGLCCGLGLVGGGFTRNSQQTADSQSRWSQPILFFWALFASWLEGASLLLLPH